VSLIGVEHAVEPGKQLLGAVVGVQDNGDAIRGSNLADVVSTGDGAGDGGGLVAVADALFVKLIVSTSILCASV
jgi:hypothetical protein